MDRSNWRIVDLAEAQSKSYADNEQPEVARDFAELAQAIADEIDGHDATARNVPYAGEYWN